MLAAAAADKRRPPMAFRDRTGYNSLPGRRAGYCAVDVRAGWGTERSDASQTPSVERPCIWDLPWLLVLDVRGKKKHKNKEEF